MKENRSRSFGMCNEKILEKRQGKSIVEIWRFKEVTRAKSSK